MSSKYPFLHILDRRWLGLVGQNVPRRDALWETAGIRYEKVVWMPLDVYMAPIRVKSRWSAETTISLTLVLDMGKTRESRRSKERCHARGNTILTVEVARSRIFYSPSIGTNRKKTIKTVSFLTYPYWHLHCNEIRCIILMEG